MRLDREFIMEQQRKPQTGNSRHRRHRGGGKPRQEVRYDPPYASEILDKSLADLGLREGTLTALTAAKILTVRDLACRRVPDMYKVQSFGKKNLGEVKALMAKLGVDFRPEDNKPEQQQPEQKKQQPKQGKDNRQQSGKPARPEQPQANKGPAPKGEDHRKNKGNKEGNKDRDDKLTLDKLYPTPKFVPSPAIPMETDRYVKFQKGGKWGFRDKGGKELIPPIYDEVFNFKDEFACVERKGLFGYINRDNELVIPYRYEVAGSFSEGLACVGNEDKCGYIDKEGNVVLPFVYDAGTAVKDGLAKIKKDGRWGTINVTTKEISWS